MIRLSPPSIFLVYCHNTENKCRIQPFHLSFCAMKESNEFIIDRIRRIKRSLNLLRSPSLFVRKAKHDVQMAPLTRKNSSGEFLWDDDTREKFLKALNAV